MKFNRDGPSTFVDAIGHYSEGVPWVYHYAPRGEERRLIADHPWDDSYEAHVCPVCCGHPFTGCEVEA